MEERGFLTVPDIFYSKETSYQADKLRVVDKNKLILFLKSGADPSSIVINHPDAKINEYTNVEFATGNDLHPVQQDIQHFVQC